MYGGSSVLPKRRSTALPSVSPSLGPSLGKTWVLLCKDFRLSHASAGVGGYRAVVSAGLVGERCECREAVRGNARGVLASEDAGISSAKTGANPVRRKPKVS